MLNLPDIASESRTVAMHVTEIYEQVYVLHTFRMPSSDT